MKTEYEKEQEKRIKIFDQAYKDWNNKKLSVEEVEMAQRIVDEMTDDYTDSHISKIRLEAYRKGMKDAKRRSSE